MHVANHSPISIREAEHRDARDQVHDLQGAEYEIAARERLRADEKASALKANPQTIGALVQLDVPDGLLPLRSRDLPPRCH